MYTWIAHQDVAALIVAHQLVAAFCSHERALPRPAQAALRERLALGLGRVADSLVRRPVASLALL